MRQSDAREPREPGSDTKHLSIGAPPNDQALESLKSDLIAVLPKDRYDDTISGVVQRLQSLTQVLEAYQPSRYLNPILSFNLLYLKVTQEVKDYLSKGKFRNEAFLERLDVEFAKLYFVALKCFATDRASCPASWQVLFGEMGGEGIKPIKSAAAGVNAHVNFDLTFALLATLHARGIQPVRPSSEYVDYRTINRIFKEQMSVLRAEAYRTETFSAMFNRINGRYDDAVQNYVLRHTRDHAWRLAEALYPRKSGSSSVREARGRQDRYVARLGRLILSGRSSLVFDPRFYGNLQALVSKEHIVEEPSFPDAVMSVRSDLAEIRAQSGAQLQPTSVEVEFEVAFAADSGFSGGLRAYVVTAGMSRMSRHAQTHRIKLTLAADRWVDEQVDVALRFIKVQKHIAIKLSDLVIARTEGKDRVPPHRLRAAKDTIDHDWIELEEVFGEVEALCPDEIGEEARSIRSCLQRLDSIKDTVAGVHAEGWTKVRGSNVVQRVEGDEEPEQTLLAARDRFLRFLQSELLLAGREPVQA